MIRATSGVLGLLVLAIAGCSSDAGSGGDGAAGGGGHVPEAILPCPVASDPCYQELLAKFQGASSCFHHPDTCGPSQGTDASGCGVQSGGQTSPCAWPDGARETLDTSTTPYTIVFTGPGGEECFRYEGLTRLKFPDGTVFELVDASQVTTLVCPDQKTIDLPRPADRYDCVFMPGDCCTDTPGVCPL